MIHPGLAALEKWDTIEYAAGYRARLAAIPDSETAHHCWRCGWEDADTEALDVVALPDHGVSDFPPLRQGKLRQILIFMDEDIEGVIVDMRFCRAEVLEQIEVGVAIRVQRYKFTVDHGACRKVVEGFGDVVEFLVEDVLPARIQRGFTDTAHDLQAIAIELDLIGPFRTLRNF
jgi:hypothetical protein